MTGADVPDSRRPALVKLVQDSSDLRSDLMTGFGSRADVLRWFQRLTVRTLGEVPQHVFEELGDQFVPMENGHPVLMAGFLAGHRRVRDDVDGDMADKLRRRFAGQYVEPAVVRSFKRLRGDASEYVGDTDGDTDHTPARQRYTAMRPSLDELGEHQERCLEQLLDGFNDKDEILDWVELVQLATHGEVPESLVTRLYREQGTVDVLCGEETVHKRARELLAARHLLPLFNEGVRDLTGRATEQPDAESVDHDVKPA